MVRLGPAYAHARARVRARARRFAAPPPTPLVPPPPNSVARRRELKARKLRLLEEFGKRTNKLSIRKLAKKYGLSTTAAHSLVTGAVAPDAHRGPQEVLPLEVEAELVAGLKRCIEHACPVPMPKLPTIVVDIARRLGVDTTDFVAGEKWMRGFFARNPSWPSAFRPRRTRRASRTGAASQRLSGARFSGRSRGASRSRRRTKWTTRHWTTRRPREGAKL